MGKWLDKLKGFINVEVKSLVGGDANLHIGKKESHTHNHITLNFGKFTPEQKEVLQKALPEAITEGYSLLEENSVKLLEEAKKSAALPENEALLRFYNGKIPDQDKMILRASMHIKHLYATKDPSAEQVKMGLIQNYEKRGKNICRLFCAGYYHGLIKNVFEEAALVPQADLSKFYEVVVTESPQAVFIEKWMSSADIKETIQKRIDGNKKYGIKRFNVHGIGYDNCLKIRRAISDLEEKGVITIEPEIEERNKVITVTLSFEETSHIPS